MSLATNAALPSLTLLKLHVIQLIISKRKILKFKFKKEKFYSNEKEL
jgi:hypothetical protein